MKSNFETLGASNSNLATVPNGISPGDGGGAGAASMNNTISNQFREGSAHQRNASTIARAQSMRDDSQNKRREELQKRIEATRTKLQNIGYQSMLRGSQSISDLTSHLPDRVHMRPDSSMSDYQPHSLVTPSRPSKFPRNKCSSKLDSIHSLAIRIKL